MLMPDTPLYKAFKVIEVPGILDILEEKFDDALSLLDSNCLIYGGTVRDILAGMPIGGDLDVVVPTYSKAKMNNKFSTSARWLNIPVNGPNNSSIQTTQKKIISSLKAYTNYNKDIVQLIIPIKTGQDQVNDIDLGAIDIILNVDIVCCGVATDIYGNIFEIIPGAVKDCKDRVLNFNKDIKATPTSIDTLKKRIIKLEQRGWTSKIDISKVTIDKSPCTFTTKPKKLSIKEIFGIKLK